jgi:uncharacterized membrane protein
MAKSSDIKLKSLATALIYMGALVSCGDDSTTVYYDSEDKGQKMPAPKLSAREKCYGIAAAQYNDCAAGKGTNCAGTADKDNMPDRWKYVAAGKCEGLKGSLQSKAELATGE